MASAPAFQAGNAGSIPVVRFNDLQQHHFGGAVFFTFKPDDVTRN